MFETFNGISLAEGQEPDPEFDEGPARVRGSFQPFVEGSSHLELEYEALNTPKWFYYEQENWALSELLGWTHQDTIVEFLLTNGLCPGQEFVFEFDVSYFQLFEGDWDADVVDFEIVECQSLPDDFHALAWEAWIGRQYASLAL